MNDSKSSVIIDGVVYVPDCGHAVPPKIVNVDRQLYLLLDQLRSAICAYRDDMRGPRLQSDVDDLDRMAAMANNAIGLVIINEAKS